MFFKLLQMKVKHSCKTGTIWTLKILSFVPRCSHLGCMSRRFDYILLVFIRRWGRLVTWNLINHYALLWLVGFQQLWLVHFDPRCSGELFSVVRFFAALLLLCFLIVGIHASGISIPLSLLMLWKWSRLLIASLTLRVYQCLYVPDS